MFIISHQKNANHHNEIPLYTQYEGYNQKAVITSTDEDVLLIDSHEFDLDETVVKSFGLELPINYMCSDNCKGLCHVCGCNLNHEKCDCEDDNIDPRLAALKDFLK